MQNIRQDELGQKLTGKGWDSRRDENRSDIYIKIPFGKAFLYSQKS